MKNVYNFFEMVVLLIMNLNEFITKYSIDVRVSMYGNEIQTIGKPEKYMHEPKSYKMITVLSLFLLGLLLVAAAYFIHRAFNFKLLTVFLILAGIGAMGVGLFPENKQLIIHVASALICFSFGGLSLIVSHKLLKPPLSYFSVLLGVVSLVALILSATFTYLGLGPGGMERMVVYPVLLWGIGIGGYFISGSK